MKKSCETEVKSTTPLKAIRAKCLDCCAYQTKEVRSCSCKDCPLWPFRFGSNPNIQMTDARRQAIEKARISKKSIVHTAILDGNLCTEGNYTDNKENEKEATQC